MLKVMWMNRAHTTSPNAAQIASPCLWEVKNIGMHKHVQALMQIFFSIPLLQWSHTSRHHDKCLLGFALNWLKQQFT